MEQKSNYGFIIYIKNYQFKNSLQYGKIINLTKLMKKNRNMENMKNIECVRHLSGTAPKELIRKQMNKLTQSAERHR